MLRLTKVAFVAVLLVAVTFVSAETCTENQINYELSECKNGFYTRMLSEVDQCEPSTQQAMPYKMPCNTTCDDGQFLDAKTKGCKKCNQGTFSVGNGYILDPALGMPSQVTTYCNPMPCSPWRALPTGEFDSGVQPVNHTHPNWNGDKWVTDQEVISDMTFKIPVVMAEGGSLSFDYRVESEDYNDGLMVFINGTHLHGNNKYTGFLLSGMHYNWRNEKRYLPQGETIVRFLYYKDPYEARNFVGSDRAYLRNIRVEGTTHAVFVCDRCPSGMYQDEAGSKDCKRCDANMKPSPEQTHCVPCASDEWSFPGSAECIKKVECDTELDFVPVYGECTADGTMDVTYKVSNMRCTVVKTPEKKTNQPCNKCMPGMKLTKVGNDDVCEPCGKGEALVDGKCTKCGSGTAAVRTVTFEDGFDTDYDGSVDSKYFTSACWGHCHDHSNSSWELYPVQVIDEKTGTKHVRIGMHSGTKLGRWYNSALNYNFTSEGTSRVTFRYTFHREIHSSNPVSERYWGSFYTEGASYKLHKSNTKGHVGELTVSLPPGNHLLTWSLFRAWDEFQTDNVVGLVLTSLIVEDDSRGGSDKCLECPSGFACPGETSHFQPCPLGQYQDKPGQTNCSACTGKTVSAHLGSKYCSWCSKGMYPSEKHDACVNTCFVDSYNGVLDLTPLNSTVFTAPGENYNYSMSLCAPASKEVCNVTTGTNPYACGMNSGSVWSLGTKPSYTWDNRLLFSHGDFCFDATTFKMSHWSTSIDLQCAENKTETYLNFTGVEGCTVNFALESPHACTKCTNNSYQTVYGACDMKTGHKNVTQVKYSWLRCTGGYTPTPVSYELCNLCTIADYDYSVSECKDGKRRRVYSVLPGKECVDGLAIADSKVSFPLHEESCSTMDATLGANKFTAIIFSSIGGVVLLGGIAYVMWKRSKNLSADYERLVAEHDEPGRVPVSMQDLDDE